LPFPSNSLERSEEEYVGESQVQEQGENSHSGLEYHPNPNYRQDDDYIMTRFTNIKDDKNYVELSANGKISGRMIDCKKGYISFTGTYKKDGKLLYFYYDNMDGYDIFELDDEEYINVSKITYYTGYGYMVACSGSSVFTMY